ncbi:MAG: hypothetical protein K0R38_7778 [Polyangiaceae bacterium]|nr:hypothetical protein [Polyangiaceae bacterium]
MDYQFDVFISYRRHPEWTPWTREHFRNLLDAYLTQDLSVQPSIFVDEHIEPGADWPQRLGDSIARARVLLPIFSGDYFGSEWCLHELDLMHARLLRFPDKILIVPVVGHDGKLIPAEIARLQPADFLQFRNTDLQRRTPRYEQFADAVQRLAPVVASAIVAAPAFDPAWVPECRDRFDQVYAAHCGGPTVPVTTLTLKPLPFPTRPPRVSM